MSYEIKNTIPQQQVEHTTKDMQNLSLENKVNTQHKDEDTSTLNSESIPKHDKHTRSVLNGSGLRVQVKISKTTDTTPTEQPEEPPKSRTDVTDDTPPQQVRLVRLFNTELLVPPLNFALVAEDVYRSGHPLEINYPFLENLNLKTIVYIGDPPSTKDKDKDSNSVRIFERYQEWAHDSGIRLIHFHQPSAKEPFRDNDKDIIRQTLEIVLDTRNLPILLNSNKGKHRVGVLVGVMRGLLQGWSLATTFDEYIKFANGKSDADLEFIERFREPIEYEEDFAPKWLRTA